MSEYYNESKKQITIPNRVSHGILKNKHDDY
jgi:hypothetical protein